MALKQTSTAHLAAARVTAGADPSATISLNVATSGSPGVEVRGLVDGKGNGLAVWTKASGIAWEHLVHAWELNVYTKNPYNCVSVTAAGLVYNENTQPKIAPITAAAYLAAYGALMAP